MKITLASLYKLSGILSDRSLSKKTKLFFKLVIFLFCRKISKKTLPIHLEFIHKRVPIPMYVVSSADIASLIEIYVYDEYKANYQNDVRIIVDLGAHHGDTALYYHSLFPSARIIAVEPMPDNFKWLQSNTKNIKEITCIQAAIGSDCASIEMYFNNSSLGSSMYKRIEGTQSFSVKQFTLKKLFKDFDIISADIIKFDIEGAEAEVFRHIQPERYSKFLIGEIHLDLMPMSKSEFLTIFSNLSIDMIQLSKSRYLIHAFNK